MRVLILPARMLLLAAFCLWPNPANGLAAESGGVNDSPRERSRVLLKRNPIASEYQAGGEVYRPDATASADAEGVDFRALFRGVLGEDSQAMTRAQLDLSGQSKAGKVLPGGNLLLIRSLPFDERWTGLLSLRHSAAERTIEHYQARWNTIDGIGVPGLPKYSQDRFDTRRWDASAGIRFASSERLALRYAFSFTDYDDSAYRNRFEPQIIRGQRLADGLVLSPELDTAIGVTSEQTPLRRYFHEIETDRRIRRHWLHARWEGERDAVELDGYLGVWRERRRWPGWNFVDSGQTVQFDAQQRSRPNLDVADQAALFDLSNGLFANFRDSDRSTRDEDQGVRAYWNHRLQWGQWQPWLRLGALYRNKERRNDQNRLVYERSGAGFGYSQVAAPGERTDVLGYDLPAAGDLGLARAALDQALGTGALLSNQATFFETLQDEYTTQETVTAGSIGLYSNGPRWQWRLGLRYEQTETDTLGTVIGPPESLAAAGIAPVNTLSVAGREFEDTFMALDGGRLAGANRYEKWLPSAAVGWKVSPHWHVHGLYYQELMRPQYFDIVNYRRINPTVNRISEGNPELAPTLVSTFGVALRWQPDTDREYTLELYRKDIEDFFYEAVQDVPIGTERFKVSRVDNGPSAEINGFRLAAKHTMTLAPGVDLNVTGSYTFSDTQAEIIQADGDLRVADLPERSRHLLQGSASVSWRQWTGSLQLRYQSVALDEVGEFASTDVYRDEALIWSGSLRYALPSAWNASLRVDNLTNAPERAFENTRDRITNNLYSYAFVTFSLSKSF